MTLQPTTARAAASFVLVVVLTAASASWGNGPSDSSPVVVSELRCASAPVVFSAFVDSLRVELAGRRQKCCDSSGAERHGDREPTVRVTLDIEPCDPNTQSVQILVEAPARGRSLRRELPLADVAQAARSRALALAVAELVRSIEQSSSEPLVQDGEPPHARETDAPPSRAPPPPRTPPPAPPPPRASETAARPGLGSIPFAALDLDLRSYPNHGTHLWGVRASLGVGRWGAFDVGGLRADRKVDLGDVVLQAVTAGLAVGPRLVRGPVEAALGLRGELGLAFVDGQASQTGVRAGRGSNLVASLGARLTIDAPVRRRLRVRLGVESGATLRGVAGDVNGAPIASMRGFYALLALGAHLSPVVRIERNE